MIAFFFFIRARMIADWIVKMFVIHVYFSFLFFFFCFGYVGFKLFYVLNHDADRCDLSVLGFCVVVSSLLFLATKILSCDAFI